MGKKVHEAEFVRPGPRCKYESWMAEEIVRVAEEGGHLAGMMVAIGVRSKETFYRWIEEFKEFKEAYEYSKIVSLKFHEEILFKGALGAIKNFNATSFAMIMNNKFSDEYKRTGNGSNTEITINQVSIPADQLDLRISQKIEQLKLLGVELDQSNKE